MVFFILGSFCPHFTLILDMPNNHHFFLKNAPILHFITIIKLKQLRQNS